MPRNQILTSQDLEDLLDYHFDEIRERMALYEETFQPMVRYYRWGIFGAKEMPLIDGTAAKSCNFINYCLWTYDYDWEEHEYCVDGFINLKEPMTLRELEAASGMLRCHPMCACLKLLLMTSSTTMLSIRRASWDGSPLLAIRLRL